MKIIKNRNNNKISNTRSKNTINFIFITLFLIFLLVSPPPPCGFPRFSGENSGEIIGVF